MKNIHILPTDKPSYLYKMSDGKLYLSDLFEKGNSAWHNQHIYITNDEEIKEGDWCLHLGKSFINGIFSDKITLVKISERYLSMNFYFWKQWDKNSQFSYSENELIKIILTTDQDLIKNNVQAIDDEFLEWFVKNPSCEEISTKSYYKTWEDGVTFDRIEYKIIIPQEEPKHPKVLSENGNELFFDEQGNLIKEEPKCTCKVGEPYNNTCCKVHGNIPQEEPKQEPEYKDNVRFMDALRHHLRFEIKKDKDYILNNPQRVRDFQKGYDWIDKPKQELERGITITHVGEQEMRLVNIETYDTKVYTFKNKEGELYHVIKQDSFLNNLYPEYRFIGPDQKEVADDESINEIKTIMKGWKK